MKLGWERARDGLWEAGGGGALGGAAARIRRSRGVSDGSERGARCTLSLRAGDAAIVPVVVDMLSTQVGVPGPTAVRFCLVAPETVARATACLLPHPRPEHTPAS